MKTVVLFFEKGKASKKVWYYQLDPGRSMGKTNPLNDGDLEEFVGLQKQLVEGPKSWTVKVGDVDAETWDLSVKNPNAAPETAVRSPHVILAEIERLDAECAAAIDKIRGLL